jgi:DNA polymerase III epsilon subunit-like protein
MNYGDLVVLDTETTSLGSTAEVIQFCGIYLDEGFNIRDIACFYCMTDTIISEGAVAVHGIDNATLAGVSAVNGIPKYFEEMISKVEWMHKGDIRYSSYNWSFDKRVMDSTLTMQGFKPLELGPLYPTPFFEGRGCFDSMMYLCNLFGGGRRMKLGVLFDRVFKGAALHSKFSEFVDNYRAKFKINSVKNTAHDAFYDTMMVCMLLAKAFSDKK